MTTNSPEYWNNWYTNELNNNFIRQDFECYDHIAMAIRSKSKGRLIDFGTGRAFFLEYIHNIHPNMILFGADHSEIAMKDAMSRMPYLTWTNDASIYPEGYFDVVTCIHTLEHFDEPVKLLKQLADMTANDGYLVIVLPLNDRPYPQHVQIWHLDDMIELFNTLGEQWTYRIIIRPQKKNQDGKVFSMVFPDDRTPMWETIAILKRTEVQE